jgi:hypothetical protein
VLSGSVDLLIETGSVWAWSATWLDSDKQPIVFSDPIMNIRREQNPKGELLARLDESGQYNGTLVIPEPGVLVVNMTPTQTSALKQGYAFWDIYVTCYENRCRLVFGTVEIAAHVTELNNA